MALDDLLLDLKTAQLKSSFKESNKIKIERNFHDVRKLISFFREYPDIFIDFIKKPSSTFNFYVNQRVVLRAMMRYQKSFVTCPRAFSKSFLAIMCTMIRATLYPNSHLFLTTGGKVIRFFALNLCRLIWKHIKLLSRN